VPLQRPTAYDQIAEQLRAAILAGEYEPAESEPTRHELPGAAELGTRYGVSDKTAARAIQQLIAEGLVKARPGLRAVVVPRTQRPDRWPMNRRYARARQAKGLVFGEDMLGRQVEKTVRTGWTAMPNRVTALLGSDGRERVWAREREMLVDGRIAETSVSYFPESVAKGTDLMTPGPFPEGGVVRVLEGAGYRILRTSNEMRARLASPEELEAFGPDPDLDPLMGRIVIEIIHATYGDNDEPLEAVVSVRPAADNVVVFDTYEGTD
jgi:GntR family transcriptional regulator